MLRILVVDDDTSTRSAVVVALTRPDRQILTAGDGDEALDLARTFAPHLVVTDVSMPKRSGFELAEALAASRETALSAILFVTGADAPEQRIRGLRLGAVDYLTKPFALEELSLRVDNALRASVGAHEIFEQTLAGGLTQIGLATLLNVLALERKSGEIGLTREADEARVLIRGGDVVAAAIAGRRTTAVEAVYALLDWREGRFVFTERPVLDADEIGVPTMALLLDGLRRHDEVRADLQTVLDAFEATDV